LQPVKEEQVLDEPAIFLFHDVVSDNDIKEIKALAVPRVCIHEKKMKDVCCTRCYNTFLK
jgi:hypothetical protein